MANVLVKPRSEKDGNLVILADNTKSLSLIDLTTGEIVERGNNTGRSNGRESTLRFTKPGEEYQNVGLMDDQGNIIATLSSAGERVQFNYDDYERLVSQPVSNIQNYRWDNSENLRAREEGRPTNAEIAEMTPEEYNAYLESLKSKPKPKKRGSGYNATTGVVAGLNLADTLYDIYYPNTNIPGTDANIISINGEAPVKAGGLNSGAASAANYGKLGLNLFKIHNSDMSGQDKGKAAAKASGMMVADMWTGGLASAAYGVLSQSKEFRDFESTLDKYNPTLAVAGYLGKKGLGGVTKNREVSKLVQLEDDGYIDRPFLGQFAVKSRGRDSINPEFEVAKAEKLGYSPEEIERKRRYAELVKMGNDEGARLELQGEDIWGDSAIIREVSDITQKKYIPGADRGGEDGASLDERQRFDISQAITDYNRMTGGKVLHGDRGRLGIHSDETLRDVIRRIGEGEEYNPSMFGELGAGYEDRVMPVLNQFDSSASDWDIYKRRWENGTFSFDDLRQSGAGGGGRALTTNDINQVGRVLDRNTYSYKERDPSFVDIYAGSRRYGAAPEPVRAPEPNPIVDSPDPARTRSLVTGRPQTNIRADEMPVGEVPAPETPEEKVARLDREINDAHFKERRRDPNRFDSSGDDLSKEDRLAQNIADKRRVTARREAEESNLPDPVFNPNLFYHVTSIDPYEYIDALSSEDPVERNNMLLNTGSPNARPAEEFASSGAPTAEASSVPSGGYDGGTTEDNTALAESVPDPYAEQQKFAEEEAAQARKLQLISMFQNSPSNQIASQLANEAFAEDRRNGRRYADAGFQQISQALGRRQ